MWPFYNEPVNLVLQADLSTYYILAYIDVNDDSRISSGEPYIIYNNQTKSGTPTPFVFNSDASISLTFGDANTW
jgi:hypothetical protein